MLSARARGTWGRQRLRWEANRRQGHGDASEAVQRQGDLLEAPTSSGSQGGEARQNRAVPSLIYGSDVTGMPGVPPAQLNETRLIARKICREKTYHRCLDLDFMLEDAGTDPGGMVLLLRSSCGTVRGPSVGSLHTG